MPYSMQSAFLDFHLENESMKYHLHHPTRKHDNNLQNRNQFLKVCVEIQSIFFNSADGNTPNLHLFFSPCISKIHLKFPSSPTATAWLFFFLQFLHFLMQRYNRAALRGCESLPKLCVGGLFFCQNFTAQQHSTFITFFFVWCKCKIPQLLESLKIWSCYCKECKIWKKPFQVCMCSFGYCMF